LNDPHRIRFAASRPDFLGISPGHVMTWVSRASAARQ
jgi:hypothetical protein